MSARLLALLLALTLPCAPSAHAAGGRAVETAVSGSAVAPVGPLGSSLGSGAGLAPLTVSPALGGTLALPSQSVSALGPAPDLTLPASPLAAAGQTPVASPVLPAPLRARQSSVSGRTPAAPAAAADAAPPSRLGALVTRVRDWLFPPQLSGSYSQSSGDSFFHGTSLANIEAAAETGGVLSAQRTYVSDEPGYPHGYARSSGRKTGTPGVVLQFPAAALEGKLVADIPLSALSPVSKQSLLAHYALARDLAPHDAAAAAKLESIARALGVAAPAPRPLLELSGLEPGHRILIPEGNTAREALFAGIKDGKVLLVAGRDGAWLDLRRVPAAEFPAVVDAGPVPVETLAAVGKLHKLDWSRGSEAERLDRRFAERGLWGKVSADARLEILGLRARKLPQAALKDYVRAEVSAAFERVKEARGLKNIGLHYNLHGGSREGYVGTGIRATKGDIALRYSMNGDSNDKVYFFQTAVHSPYDALDASNGEILLFPSRMGSVLSVFDVDAPELTAARADGRIRGFGAISMDFHGMAGVPYAAYLAPPMQVFVDTAQKLGLRRLSRDEETLATVRFLEAALTEAGADVPGGVPAGDAAVAAAAAARAAAAAAAWPDPPPRFRLVNGAYYYHGTTLADLERILRSGGEMSPEVSMFSQRAEDSVGYAAERKRKLGSADNPAVLLQFRAEDLSPLVSGKAFAAALAATDRGMPPIHAAYAAATKPVPLSLMTQESKESLLVWLRANAARRPGEPRWAELAALCERALAP